MDTTTTEPALDLSPDLCHQKAHELHVNGQLREAETIYRAALALDPGRAASWSALGLAVLKGGRADEAIACQREALRLDPGHAEAHNNLGIAMHSLNALAEAENHFHGVLRLDPGHASAMLNLGVIRQSLGYLEEAEALYRRARELGCDEPRVCNNLALVLAELGQFAEAEAVCRAALDAAPGYPEADINLGMILLMRGKLAEAWPHYEARWRVPPLALQRRLPAHKRWTGAQSVQGKTILLLAEQGFGDTFQFCRYVPLLADMGAEVVLAVPESLVRVMETVPGVARVAGETDAVPAHDLHCHLLSLPIAFGTTVETIPCRMPYLCADPRAVAAWDALIPAASDTIGPRVGLVWAGANRPDQPLAAAIDRRRSMVLADLAPLGAVPGCVFVSLQVGPPAKQAGSAPFPLIDVTGRLTDFADTAALIQTLDLVICVDTAVAHLAAAMGKPVWLLSRYDACWRWLQGTSETGREDSPWYPTLRLFRQTVAGDWGSVVGRVAEALAEFGR